MTTTALTPNKHLGAVTCADTVGFGRLLRVEFRKLFNTKAGVVLPLIMLFALVAATIGYVFLMPLLGGEWSSPFVLIGVAPMLLLPVMGVLSVTAEWSQRTALTTFVLEPRRARVLAAKGVAITSISVATAALVLLCSQVALRLGHFKHNISADTTLNFWRVFGVTLVFVLLGALGFSLGAMLRSAPAAIVTVFVAPTLATTIMQFGPFYRDLMRWLELQCASGVLSSGTAPTLTEWAQVGTASVIWLVIPIAIGLWVQRVSEPK